MARKNPDGIGKPLLKNDNKSIAAEEINFRDLRKSLTKAEYTLTESEPSQRMHSRLIIRDDDPSDPWYFTHT